MATEFEIKVKVGAEVDAASVTATATALDSKLGGVLDEFENRKLELPEIDVSPIEIPPIDVPPIDLPPISVPPIDIPPLDIPDFDLPETKTVSQLALDFNEATAAAKKLEAEQRSALAALIAAGDEGSDQYVELVANIVDARKQSEELAAAQKRVDDIFAGLDTPPPAPPVPDVPDNNLGQRVFEFNQLSEIVDRAAESLTAITQPAVEFGSSLAAVGAITGQSGEPLEKLGGVARDLALQFGGPATDQLGAFQGVLSKMGAQVADTPAALGKIAENINILSKASGDDAATSMQAIVNSMLQFGEVTGDSNKDAETSTRYINALAASAQVGAAEIPQVAEAILQAGVAAKGANLDFEQTNAALQVLALGGKVGSEAGIGLRNVLGLLQNASGPAEEAMAKMGTSSKELGEVLTTQGLGPAMDIIRSGMNALGSDAERNSTLMTIFGTENAAAAGILIDNGAKLQEFEQGIRAGQEGMGAAFSQAAQRMNTAEGQIARAQAFIQEGFMQITDVLGEQVTAAAATFANLAPTLQGVSGLKELIPDGIFDKAGAALKGVLLPALSQLGILKKVNQAITVAETGAELANAAAKGVQTVATGSATTAQYGLNTAMLANPVFLITAGIAALVGAFILFGDSTKDLGTALEDANAAKEEFVKADAMADSAKKSADGISKLADEFDKLKGKGDPESQKRFNEVAAELAQQVPEAVTAIDQFNAVGEKTGTTYEASTKLVRQMADEQKRLADEIKANALANLDDQVGALADSYTEALAAQKELREDKAELQKAVESGLGGLATSDLFGNPFDSMQDDLSDTTAELAEQNKKLNEARPQIESLVDGYQDMGLSVEEIAKRTGFTVEQVKEFKGELQGSLVSSKNLENAIGGMDVAQQRLVRATALQAEGYQQAQGKVDELNAKLADAKFGGDTELVKKLEGELDDAQKVADEKKVKLEAQLEEQGVKDALAAIPEAARGTIVPLTTTLDVVLSDKSLAETQQKASGLARDISELQKQQAEAIGTAQEGAYDEKLLAKQNEFRSNLEKQAVAIATNETRLKQLKIEKDAATDPKEVARLKGEIETLEQKTDGAAKQFINAANAGKRVGAIQGDVKNVATEFGFTGQAAQGAARAVDEIDASNKKTGQSAADLTAEFQRMREQASSGLEAAKQEAIGLLAQIRTTIDAEEKARLQELYNKAIERAKSSAAGTIEGDRIIRDVENAIGVTSLSELERRQEEERRKREEAARKRREEQERRVKAQLEADRTDAQRIVDAMAEGLSKQIAQADLEVQFKKRENDLLEGLDRAALRRGDILIAELRANEATRTRDLEQLQRDRQKVIADAVGDIGQDFLDTDITRLKSRSETMRAEADRITANDAASIKRRTELTIQALQLATKAQVDEIINGSAEFISTVTREAKPQEEALIAAKIALVEAQNTTDQAQIDAAQATFDAAQRDYKTRVLTLRESFLQSNLEANTLLGQTITNALEKGEDQTVTITTKGNADEIAAVRRQLIATITDLNEQEKELRLLAINEQLAADLEANENNEAKKVQLIRDAARARGQVEADYLKSQQFAWQQSITFIETLLDGLQSKVDPQRQEALEKDIDAIDAREDALAESLLRQTISVTEFDSQMISLAEERAEKERELARSTGEFWTDAWEGIRSGAVAAFAAVADSQRDVITRAAADVDDVKFLDIAVNLATTIGAAGVAAAATHEDALHVMVSATFDALQAMVPVFSAMIFGYSVATADGVLTLGATAFAKWAALTAALATLVAGARAGLGFMDGGYTGDVPVDQPVGPAHGQEFVHTAAVTRIPENRELFEHLHAGGSQRDWFADYGADLGFVTIADLDDLYIDIDGRLQAGFESMAALQRQTSAIGDELEHGERMSVFITESQAFTSQAAEQGLAVADYVDELRANREATLVAGQSTVNAIAELTSEVAEVKALLRGHAQRTELEDFNARHETADRFGAESREDTLIGTLKDVIDAIRRSKR